MGVRGGASFLMVNHISFPWRGFLGKVMGSFAPSLGGLGAPAAPSYLAIFDMGALIALPSCVCLDPQVLELRPQILQLVSGGPRLAEEAPQCAHDALRGVDTRSAFFWVWLTEGVRLEVR